MNPLPQFFQWFSPQGYEDKPMESQQPEPGPDPDVRSQLSVTEGDSDDFNADDDKHQFPTHPAFTIPVEIKPTERLGKDQYGVFAAEDIPANTHFWLWTDRVVEIHCSEIYQYIATNFAENDVEGIRRFLRRGFVLPSPYDDTFYSNPTDAGALMNHSSTPNCVRPQGTARLIKAGEELTCDYGDNGNPIWLVDLCHKYGMLTPVEIAEAERSRGGIVQSSEYTGPVKNTLLESMATLQGMF